MFSSGNGTVRFAWNQPSPDRPDDARCRSGATNTLSVRAYVLDGQGTRMEVYAGDGRAQDPLFHRGLVVAVVEALKYRNSSHPVRCRTFPASALRIKARSLFPLAGLRSK